jgi:hypothetical protein
MITCGAPCVSEYSHVRRNYKNRMCNKYELYFVHFMYSTLMLKGVGGCRGHFFFNYFTLFIFFFFVLHQFQEVGIRDSDNENSHERMD